MRTLIAVPLWISLGLGCSAGNSLTDNDPGSAPGDPLICVGDPDSRMVCKKASEFWDCTLLPNGDKKCAHQVPQQPPGGSAWVCTQEELTIACTTSTPGAPLPPGESGWTCVASDGVITCEEDAPVPPGGGAWSCAFQEFVWTCIGGNVPPGGSSSSGIAPGGSQTGGSSGGGSSGGGSSGGGSSGGGSSGGGSSGGGSALVCNHYYAAKWQTGGSGVGGCEGVPGNDQDCDAIRDLLSAGFKAPFTNGACTISPVKVGGSWVLTLPAGCHFLQGGACGKYGGNVFLGASGATKISLPAQQGTGLSHLEALWCCE